MKAIGFHGKHQYQTHHEESYVRFFLEWQTRRLRENDLLMTNRYGYLTYHPDDEDASTVFSPRVAKRLMKFIDKRMIETQTYATKHANGYLHFYQSHWGQGTFVRLQNRSFLHFPQCYTIYNCFIKNKFRRFFLNITDAEHYINKELEWEVT